jgi:hypothetical protein
MGSFSDMDTSVYWDQAKRFLPERINTLFVAESPPAFKREDAKSYFYFENTYGGDILFATMAKALFNVTYHKDPIRKKMLLHRFQKEKRCFLVDAVHYPLNRDREWNKIYSLERKEHIRGNKLAFFNFLEGLGREGHLNIGSRFILIKETVYDVLYEDLASKYHVLNRGYIGFPRYHGDQSFVDSIRELLSCKM